MNTDLAELLVQSTKTAMSRSRTVLSFVCGGSIVTLIAGWNTYNSGRHLLIKNYQENKLLTDGDLLSRFDSGYITLPWLEIQLHIEDDVLLFSTGLLALIGWLFYTLRRENHLLGKVFDLAGESDKHIKQYIYYGIMGVSIFTTTSDDDTPYNAEKFRKEKSAKDKSWAKYPFYTLFLLPSISIFSIVFNYVQSTLIIPSYFQDAFPPISTYEIFLVFLIMLIGAITLFGCLVLGVKCMMFQTDSTDELRSFFASHIDERPKGDQ